MDTECSVKKYSTMDNKNVYQFETNGCDQEINFIELIQPNPFHKLSTHSKMKRLNISTIS